MANLESKDIVEGVITSKSGNINSKFFIGDCVSDFLTAMCESRNGKYVKVTVEIYDVNPNVKPEESVIEGYSVSFPDGTEREYSENELEILKKDVSSVEHEIVYETISEKEEVFSKMEKLREFIEENKPQETNEYDLETRLEAIAAGTYKFSEAILPENYVEQVTEKEETSQNQDYWANNII